MSKTYKVYTKWVGYSEIEVEAKSKEEAGEKVLDGDYSLFREASTGGDLDYGFDNEEITNIELKDDNWYFYWAYVFWWYIYCGNNDVLNY